MKSDYMFLNIDKVGRDVLAAIDDGGLEVTYGGLVDEFAAFAALDLPRSVVFCLCRNCCGSLAGYLALYECGMVPLLLGAKLDIDLLATLDGLYQPAYYWLPSEMAAGCGGETVHESLGYALVRTAWDPYPVNERLSLLLTTSGSTGSPKLVRHKYGNLEVNAHNVADVFGWTPEDRGICDLPMNYTMGLNVINSHLAAGASVLLCERNLMDPAFWNFAREMRGTDFCGVPFSYEVLCRIRFDQMDLPDLRVLAEGGGRLTDKRFQWLAEVCECTGRRFFATFGTTETSARMAALPPELALEKTGSIGYAIPGGELFLADEVELENGNISGELCYRGPNVTMGYAICREDLLRGDDFVGEYHTGDIAERDADGCYYITGRKSRFLKLYGLRVGLDECEALVKTEFACDCACVGDDRRLTAFVTDEAAARDAAEFLSEKLKIHRGSFEARYLSELPRNEYGKVRLVELQEMVSKPNR